MGCGYLLLNAAAVQPTTSQGQIRQAKSRRNRCDRRAQPLPSGVVSNTQYTLSNRKIQYTRWWLQDPSPKFENVGVLPSDAVEIGKQFQRLLRLVGA
jgi:hypothetical protein